MFGNGYFAAYYGDGFFGAGGAITSGTTIPIPLRTRVVSTAASWT